MRIAGAISVQRPGPAWVRGTAARPIHPFAIAGIASARTLLPPHRGDAAWLTLLAAQAYGEQRPVDRAAALNAYAASERDDGPIRALLA